MDCAFQKSQTTMIITPIPPAEFKHISQRHMSRAPPRGGDYSNVQRKKFMLFTTLRSRMEMIPWI